MKIFILLFLILLPINASASSLTTGKIIEADNNSKTKDSPLIDFNGNIGLGTLVPSNKLQVIGGGIGGELVNKGWELIIPSPAGLTSLTTEVNQLIKHKGNLYIAYYDASGGTPSAQIYKWDGNSVSQVHSFGTGNHFQSVPSLTEYYGNLYAGIQGSSAGDGDVYVSTDDGATWSKSLDDASAQFAYSLAVYKGKLYEGKGFSSSKIDSFDGTTWKNVYSGLVGASSGLVNKLYVYKGMLFGGIGNGGLHGGIVSTSDGTNFNVELTGYSVVRFAEFNGHLYATTQVSVPTPLFERNDSNGTWFQVTTFTNASQCWGINNYNGALYVGCTVSGGAQVFKSYDGYNFSVDFTNSSGGLGTEVFAMGNYDGSLYVGLGFNTNGTADVWRKTDSLGQQSDNWAKILNTVRQNTNNGYNWPDDPSLIEATSPWNFDSQIRALGGINWQDLPLSSSIHSTNINWADTSFGTNTTNYVLTAGAGGIATFQPSSGGGSSQWSSINTNDVYLPNSGNVGIGTSATTSAQLEIDQPASTGTSLTNLSIINTSSIQLDNSVNTGTSESLDNNWEAIKFTTGLGTTDGTVCTQLKVSAATITNPAQQYELRVYTDSAGVPNAQVGSSGTSFNKLGELTTSFKNECVSLGVTLSSSTSYWLVIKEDNVPIGATVSINSGTTGSNAHAFSATGAGGSWTTESSKDGYIVIYSKTPNIISTNVSTPSFGSSIVATSFLSSSILATSTGQNAVSGTNVNNGQGGLFTGNLGNGLLAQSSHGFGIQTTSLDGLTIKAQQTGSMTFNAFAPTAYILRSPTIGAFDNTAPVLRVESSVADTGDLLSVVKQNVPKIITTSTGYTFINGTGGLRVLDSSSLGSEKVTNGTFTGNANSWTLNTGWAYNSNNVTHTIGNTGAMTQTIGAVNGESYLLTITVLNTTGQVSLTGNFTISLGGVTFGKWIDDTHASAIFSLTRNFIGTATGTGDLTITPSTDFNGTVDTISVKKITAGDLNVQGNSYFTGNVGVATLVPGQALDVVGTVRASDFTVGSTEVCRQDGTNCPSSGSGSVTSVTVSSPSSTLSLGGTNPVTTSGTINADINLTNNNTWTGQQIFNTANVGINSSSPGQTLDVFGTIRATNLLVGPKNVCLSDGTNCLGGGSGLWNVTNTNDVYEANGSTLGNVGIGTSLTGKAALAVMNGNVGIGTWVPSSLLFVGTGTSGSVGVAISNGAVSIVDPASSTTGLTITAASLTSGRGMLANCSSTGLVNDCVEINNSSASNTVPTLKLLNAGSGPGLYVQTGNVGIGTALARQNLDVLGTIRAGSFMGPGAATPFNGSCGTTAVTSITVDHGVITSCTGV